MPNKKAQNGAGLHVGQIFNHTYGIVTIVGWLGISASTLFSFFLKSWHLLIPAGVLLLLLSLLRFCKTHNRRIIAWVMDLLSPNFSYRLSLWEVNYEYKSMSEMRYETKYVVHALRTGVDHIRIRFNWSGSPDATPRPVKRQGYHTKKLEFDGMEYGYKYYNVFSWSAFNKSDGPVTLGVVSDPLIVTDPEALSHHLLTSMTMPSDRLTMRVTLPYEISPENVEFFEFLHATDDFHFHWHKYDEEHPYSQDKMVELTDGKWVITWDIPHPIYGGKYLIKWLPTEHGRTDSATPELSALIQGGLNS